jgi:hypothetical protein
MSESEVPEKLALGVSQVHELQITLRKAGWTNADIDRLTKNVGLCRRTLALIRVTAQSGSGFKTVQVSDLAHRDFLSAVYSAVGLASLDHHYHEYDFLRDERGQVYEVMTWKPGLCPCSADIIHEHFAGLGFRGNAAAFLEWIMDGPGEGSFITVPDDDGCYHGANQYTYVPHLWHNGSRPMLSLDALGSWHSGCTFVAFRKVKTS